MPTEQEKLVKRKKWYPILASNEFNNVEIGELPASEANFLIGRNLPVSLSNVINDIKKQNIRITFKITKIQDNKAITEAIAYELSPMQVKRLIRPDKSKIDDSFLCETKDNIRVRIKTFLLTRNKTKRSVLSALRKATRSFIIENTKNQDYSSLLLSLASYKLQNDLKNQLNRIYPLTACYIRRLER